MSSNEWKVNVDLVSVAKVMAAMQFMREDGKRRAAELLHDQKMKEIQLNHEKDLPTNERKKLERTRFYDDLNKELKMWHGIRCSWLTPRSERMLVQQRMLNDVQMRAGTDCRHELSRKFSEHKCSEGLADFSGVVSAMIEHELHYS